ncbi:dirigent protein 22-like [Rhodamnia argentea]|uniref:Dirigent protein n=1 Tax=Rhodamnia argentea TaxID=178133 RepID=A0A8B8QK42_9MYRT|nr:dirigent protein 22-like [Rhodamnia argentea]
MSRLVIALSLLSCVAVAAAGKSHGYARNLEADLQNTIPRKEKLTHIHFFFHDILTGPNPSAITIVPPRSNLSTLFGQVCVIDDPLTMGPDLNSGIIGRAQGLYSSASQEEAALLLAMNLVFTEGEHKGSTLTVLGRNSIFMKVREMPVIGGTGVFRFARGYVNARTYQFDMKTGLTIVEYDVYVWH